MIRQKCVPMIGLLSFLVSTLCWASTFSPRLKAIAVSPPIPTNAQLEEALLNHWKLPPAEVQEILAVDFQGQNDDLSHQVARLIIGRNYNALGPEFSGLVREVTLWQIAVMIKNPTRRSAQETENLVLGNVKHGEEHKVFSAMSITSFDENCRVFSPTTFANIEKAASVLGFVGIVTLMGMTLGYSCSIYSDPEVNKKYCELNFFTTMLSVAAFLAGPLWFKYFNPFRRKTKDFIQLAEKLIKLDKEYRSNHIDKPITRKLGLHLKTPRFSPQTLDVLKSAFNSSYIQKPS